MPDAAQAAVPHAPDVAATSGAPFPNAAMPTRESRAKLLWIRLATALALLAGAVYLGWRALETSTCRSGGWPYHCCCSRDTLCSDCSCTPAGCGTCTR